MRATDFLTEVFSTKSLMSNRYPLEWDDPGRGGIIRARTETELGNKLVMDFYSIYDLNHYICEFTVNDHYDIRGTNERDVIPLFNTIIYGVLRFIKKYQPNYLIFSAREKSRISLYSRLVNTFAPALGYHNYSVSDLPEELQEYLKFQGKSFVLAKNSVGTQNNELGEATTTHRSIHNALISKGYKYLGSGIDQYAYIEPTTGNVLKIFGASKKGKDLQGQPFSNEHAMFFTWVRYCMKHPNNPFFPKFYGYESFEHRGKTYLQIQQEKLESLDSDVCFILRALRTYLNYNDKYEVMLTDLKKRLGEDKDNVLDTVIKQLGGERQFKYFYETLKFVWYLGLSKSYSPDFHCGNILQRLDGTPVILDPWTTAIH